MRLEKHLYDYWSEVAAQMVFERTSRSVKCARIETDRCWQRRKLIRNMAKGETRHSTLYLLMPATTIDPKYEILKLPLPFKLIICKFKINRINNNGIRLPDALQRVFRTSLNIYLNDFCYLLRLMLSCTTSKTSGETNRFRFGAWEPLYSLAVASKKKH